MLFNIKVAGILSLFLTLSVSAQLQERTIRIPSGLFKRLIQYGIDPVIARKRGIDSDIKNITGKRTVSQFLELFYAIIERYKNYLDRPGFEKEFDIFTIEWPLHKELLLSLGFTFEEVR